MKKPIFILLAVLVLAFTACSKDEGFYIADEKEEGSTHTPGELGDDEGNPTSNAQRISFIATLNRTAEGEYFLQVDADTRIYPANFKDLCHIEPDCPCRIVGEVLVFDGQLNDLGTYGTLEWFDFIEKGPVLPEPGEGKDGVDVLADWMTSLEDGFLTLHFQTWWGFEPRRHELRLVYGTNPDDPYELLLVHNANRDPKSFQADALVYFDLTDALPVPEDPAHTTVTLKWTNDAGQTQSRSFPYAGRY